MVLPHAGSERGGVHLPVVIDRRYHHRAGDGRKEPVPMLVRHVDLANFTHIIHGLR